jgi:hypothetical protein
VFFSACSATAMGPFTVFADPGEYEFHSCERLAATRPSLKARAQELKLLMDKAEQSTGGFTDYSVIFWGFPARKNNARSPCP